MHVTLPRSWWWSRGLVSIVALMAFLLPPGLAADISYAYDSVGNLTGITHQPSTTILTATAPSGCTTDPVSITRL
ncbi:MAG: hypothetical protein KF693_15350 [Nitrospira sp.]|nr:hypothetical protein [Nitrospira sp.]